MQREEAAPRYAHHGQRQGLRFGGGRLMSGATSRTLRNVYGAFVSSPLINRVQSALLGRKTLEGAVGRAADLSVRGRDRATLIDLGGGSAPYRHLWPSTWSYICVDPDSRVSDRVNRQESTLFLSASADAVPMESGSADVVVMLAMSHHLDDAALLESRQEVQRLLRDDGLLIFMDGLRGSRVRSRIGWKLDVGKWPRTDQVLLDWLSGVGTIIHEERFSLLHDVLLVVVRKGPRFLGHVLHLQTDDESNP